MFNVTIFSRYCPFVMYTGLRNDPKYFLHDRIERLNRVARCLFQFVWLENGWKETNFVCFVQNENRRSNNTQGVLWHMWRARQRIAAACKLHKCSKHSESSSVNSEIYWKARKLNVIIYSQLISKVHCSNNTLTRRILGLTESFRFQYVL